MTPALRAAVTRTDITPRDVRGLNAMGAEFTGIHDPLWARVLMISDGVTEIIVVSLDALEIGLADDLRRRLSQVTGVSPDAILVAPSHSHNAPRIADVPPGALSRPASPESLAYTELVYRELDVAASTLRDALQPVSVGSAHAHVDVNVNRDVRDEGGWTLGANEDGPSDTSLTCLSFTTAGGDVLATILSYAVHPTVSLGTGILGADLVGATALRLSAEGGGEVLWLPGCLGDQAPRRGLEHGLPDCAGPAEAYAAIAEQGAAIATAAAESVRDLSDRSSSVPLGYAAGAVTFPARPGRDLPVDMVRASVAHLELALVVLVIGRMILLGIGGEVTVPAGEVIRAALPERQVRIVSLANQRVGYLPSDDELARGTFAARGCPVGPGWATAVATAVKDLIARASDVCRERTDEE